MFGKGTLICTKKGNAQRFYPFFMRVQTIDLPCGGLFIYLCEDAAIASQARACGKFEYNAGFDIDRYAIECPCMKVDPESCPAYQKTRELVEAHVLDGRILDPDAVPVDVKPDPVDGKMVVTRVCYGDGRCGPISDNECKSPVNWFSDLFVVAESCNRKVTARVVDGHGNSRKGNDVSSAHGGIIAFFKRLFRR